MTPEQRIKYLEIENAQMRRDAAALRKKLAETSAHTRRVEKAYQDGLLLATWCAGGIAPSRRFAARHQISQRRWQNSCGLLRMARVLDRNRHWTTTDLATIERRLERARQQAIESPDAFKARLNRHARNETRHRGR